MTCCDIMMVTYNRLELTKRTLDCIFNNTDYPYNLIIVDNGSKDGTVEYLEKIRSKNIILKKNKENKGIAIGRNQALSLSTNEWLATFDNDVLVPKGWLTECIEILKANRQYGSIGVNFEDTTYPLIKLGNKEFQNKAQGNLGTACMVFKRSLHKMLGWFNSNDYGMYGEEDADWGMRTRVLGLKLGYIKENGEHIGSGKYDVGTYREFKTKSHQNNLRKFNTNCGAYIRKEKSLYIPFKQE